MRKVLPAFLAALLAAPALLVSPAGAQERTNNEVIASAPPILIAEPADDSVDVASAQAQALFRELQADLPIDPESSEPTPGIAARTANATAGFSVDYNSTYPAPAAVRTVINAVVDNWNSTVATTTGPVEIEFYWQCLDPGLLGLAGPVGFYRHSGLPTSDWYPAPLANTLLGYDVNDDFEGKPLPEIQVILNASLAAGNSCGTTGGAWYIGTSGSPSSSQIDLYSVAPRDWPWLGLPELGQQHGRLPGLESPYPFVFDRQLLYNGSSLISDSNPNARLTSDALTIGVGTGWTYDIYAPTSWAQGSSLSHFDEAASAPGTPGAIMTPALGNGQVERVVDAPTAGVMQRIGWPMKREAVGPTGLTASVSGSTVAASWTIPMTSAGLPPTSHLIKLYVDGVLTTTTTVAGTATSGSVGGFVAGKTTRSRSQPAAPAAPPVAHRCHPPLPPRSPRPATRRAAPSPGPPRRRRRR
ncbi:MAG: hypothetical protein R2706_16055 [Acidimicrobiales bacterium]